MSLSGIYTLHKFTHTSPTTTHVVLIDSSTYGRFMSRLFISTLASDNFHNHRQKENDCRMIELEKTG
jgi:hypothetical protein